MNNFLKTLGPGILFASTAIGVSHLVQSTQAGAGFGFTLLWAILLANLFKYPFFEFGSRYANATGESIIRGYHRLGKPVIISYFLITIVSMFLVTAAVGFVTSGFMQQLFGIKDTLLTVVIVFLVCISILISDNFKILDGLIKIIGITLLISTLTAFILVLIKGPVSSSSMFSFENINSKEYLLFLIPLMGWMPTALDLSAWNSLWTVERIRQSGYYPKLNETLREFNLGYIISALLAICFLTLGAFIMFGSGLEFSASGVVFSGQVIALYTETFGDWAYWVIAISAFSIMFGTCIAVFDGYSRAMSATLPLLFNKSDDSVFNQNLKAGAQQQINSRATYRIVLLIVAIGAFSLIALFLNNPEGFKALVNLATSVSFLIAPAIAIFNFKLVSEKYVGKENVPPIWMRVLAVLGIIFLSAFTLLFLFKGYLIG